MGTPRRARPRTWAAARPMPAGFAAASALEQILAAITGVEWRMEEKVSMLEARMTEGREARAANKNESEVRAAARLLADAEEREKRLAVKLPALDTIEMELTQKGQWEMKQWEDLARVLKARRREIREMRQAVDSWASEIAREGRAHQEGPGVAVIAGAAAPATAGATQPMEGVVATADMEGEAEQGDVMEGVEREGLYEYRHAPAPGEPVPAAMGGEKEQGKEKGKGKAVQIATPPATGRAARQRKRQAAVEAAKAREPERPAAPTRPILKRPQTAEAEKREQEKRGEEEAAMKDAEKAGREEEAKAAAMKRWEAGELSQKEGETYSATARQIWDLTGDAGDTQEAAAGRRIAHMAGIRALGSQWEEDRVRGRMAPLQG